MSFGGPYRNAGLCSINLQQICGGAL